MLSWQLAKISLIFKKYIFVSDKVDFISFFFMVSVVIKYTSTDLHYAHILFAATDGHFGFQELVKTLKQENIRA